MKKKQQSMSVVDIVYEIAEPIAKSLDLDIWDIEYKKEGSIYILRIYLDKEGGITIDDCEAFSRAIDKPLDDRDPIKEHYYLEVSSAGIDRILRKKEHYNKFIGSNVDVHLYKPIDNSKFFQGELISFDGEKVTINYEGQPKSFDIKDVSVVKLSIDL